MIVKYSEYDTAAEGQVAPFEEGPLCRRLQSHALPQGIVTMSAPSSPLPQVVNATVTTTTTTTTTTRTSSHNQENSEPSVTITHTIRPECLHRNQTTTITTRLPCECNDNDSSCSCRGQSPNPRKRKLKEDEEAEEKSEVVTSYNVNLEEYRRLLLTRRKLLSNLAQKNNAPLFYLYGDLLLIPKYKWGSGMGIGGGRRTSLNDPDLTTPIGPGSSLGGSSQPHPRSKTDSLVQVCPDSELLEEGGFRPEWFAEVIKPVMNDLNKYGVCVVDNFLGKERAEQILSEVGDLHCRGVFHDGQVVSRNVQDQARGIIRGDKITWVTGGEPGCGSIGQLVSVVDTLIAKANKHQDAGELAKYSITWRTRAMVACYPGQGTHYVKHVDNPDGDGRCITAIYYINKDWTPEDGGVLRIYPDGSNQVAEITPVFDRMLFFWSDRRNPHEVLPATVTSRYAITVWYLDQREREEYLSRVSRSPTHT